LGLEVVLTDAYNTVILYVWYYSIDIHFISFGVEFEDGLFISVLKNSATRPKNLQLEIKKLLYIVKFVKRPPAYLISQHASVCVALGQDLPHRSEFLK
jgi:hypothetical protein